MPRKGTGRWVARAAATGGGRTYRGQAPVRWYASLALISVLGVSLVAYSRYELAHPSGSAQPTVGSHWYAALSFQVCGGSQDQQTLPANPATPATPQIRTEGDGVVRIEPTSSAYAGGNATLGKFVKGYNGLTITSRVLTLPNKGTYMNGAKCPTGTPDAGKRGSVQVKMWPSFSGSGANSPQIISNPPSLKFANGQLITVAFVPSGTSIGKPSSQTISTLLTLTSGQSTTTTTAPTPSVTQPSTSTTAP